MLKFKKFEAKDLEHLRKYFCLPDEASSEHSLVNMLVWGDFFGNMWAEMDGQLIMKSHNYFRMPLGDDFQRGICLIMEHTDNPVFYAQEGGNMQKFCELFKEAYAFEEIGDAADYLYLREELANLSGKKYHSKRNHIASFSKKYKWEYRPITKESINDVKLCAEAWYMEKTDNTDDYMICEKGAISTVLDSMDCLGVSGGAVYVEGKVVAFTMGSPINEDVFDIHFEKALADFAEGYSVINREFAKTLIEYKYINREDDMGLEGLRKAKLSYKPVKLIKKYVCEMKKNE